MADFYREVAVNVQYWSYAAWREVSISRVKDEGFVVVQVIYPSKVKQLGAFYTLKDAEKWLLTQIELHPKRYREKKGP